METDKLNQLKSLRLLYVEDDPEIREQFTSLLKNFSDTIYVAENGQDGLQLFHEHSPDIIICDLRMPQMNGMQMAKEIRTINSDVPIIITTAHNESNLLLEAINLSLDSYVLKPVDINILFNALKRNAEIVLLRKEQLRRAKELSFILDMNPSLILVVKDNQIEYINRTFLEYLKYDSLEEFLCDKTRFINCELQQHDSISCIYNRKLWLRNIFEKPHGIHFICLCRDPENKHDEQQYFIAKHNKIPGDEKYIIALQDVTELEREKTLLEQKSNIDALTGVANRRHYEEVLIAEFERARRYNSELSLVVLDIDHFKKINDSFGHSVGDETLIALGELISTNIRTHDFFARIGGEEFAIIAPEVGLNEAMEFAHKLQKKIAEHSFEKIEKLTCSFGVSQINGEDTIAALFDRADKALYRAKNQGRNCVVMES